MMRNKEPTSGSSLRLLKFTWVKRSWEMTLSLTITRYSRDHWPASSADVTLPQSTDPPSDTSHSVSWKRKQILTRAAMSKIRICRQFYALTKHHWQNSHFLREHVRLFCHIFWKKCLHSLFWQGVSKNVSKGFFCNMKIKFLRCIKRSSLYKFTKSLHILNKTEERGKMTNRRGI